MIIWAGTSSNDVGMIVEHYPHVIIPRRKQEIQSVPGRNGDIILYQDAFENYEQSYQVFMNAKPKGGLQKTVPLISDWLLGHSGYQRLEDSYFPDVYRMAYYTGGVDFVSVFNEYGEGTLTFQCAPEKYYKMGERQVSISKGQILTNPTLFPAKPLVTLVGIGTGTLTFTYDNVAHSMTIRGIGGTMKLDLREHTCTISNGTIDRMDRVEGHFEDMVLKGKTTITWDGGIETVSLVPRWWTI